MLAAHIALCAAVALSADAQQRLAITTPPRRGGVPVSIMLTSASGITAGVTSAAGAGGVPSDRLGTLSLSSLRQGFAYDRGLAVRLINSTELGATVHDGVVAFHGAFDFEVAGGYRLRLTKTQGPFVRAGMQALIAGDPIYYQSLLEIPQGQLGYQYLAGNVLVDLAGKTGFSILGRSDAGHFGDRHLDQVVDSGALFTIKAGSLLAMGEWSHFFVRGGGDPVDWVTVSLCGLLRRLAVCTRVAAMEEDTLSGSTRTHARVDQVGLTIGSSRL